MASVRALSPSGLFNFMAEPTRPVVFQVGETNGCHIRGSIRVPAEAAGDEVRWEELLLGLEAEGCLDSCAPIIVCSTDAHAGSLSASSICSDAVVEAVLSVTCVHLLPPDRLEALSPLLLGDGEPLCLPARVVAAPGNLFLGGRDAASNLASLRSLGVDSVLNATDDLPNFHEDEFNYLRIPLSDVPEENLASHLNTAVGWLSSELSSGRSVLVHCHFGVSRSASIVIAYLMHTLRCSFEEAFKQLRLSRWSVCPNSGFTEQLKHFGGSRSAALCL